MCAPLSIFATLSRGTDSGYQSFTMNNIGDIQSVSSDGTTTNRTTNADNQVINIGSATISYDNNGNVTTDDKGNTLVYDAWNRLVEVKNSSGDLIAGYTYDGLGRMTSETDGITTIDFYYSGQQIVEERTGVTNATGGSTGSNGSVTEELVYSPDYVNDVLSRDTYVSGSYSSRVFFTHDANYDVTGVVQNSTAGTMLQRMTYDAYGNVTFLTSNWVATTDGYAVENLWQGGWRDVNTGYYHFQNRWYSPSMQWLSWDPANYPDGPSGYLPMEDNPIGEKDPSGAIAVSFVSSAPSLSGSFDVKFQFTLDRKDASADGYIVQEVTDTRIVDTDCSQGTITNYGPATNKTNGVGTPVVYWEAWRVVKGKAQGTAVSTVGFTDEPTNSPWNGTAGTVVQSGQIKFYLASKCGGFRGSVLEPLYPA